MSPFRKETFCWIHCCIIHDTSVNKSKSNVAQNMAWQYCFWKLQCNDNANNRHKQTCHYYSIRVWLSYAYMYDLGLDNKMWQKNAFFTQLFSGINLTLFQYPHTSTAHGLCWGLLPQTRNCNPSGLPKQNFHAPPINTSRSIRKVFMLFIVYLSEV